MSWKLTAALVSAGVFACAGGGYMVAGLLRPIPSAPVAVVKAPTGAPPFEPFSQVQKKFFASERGHPLTMQEEWEVRVWVDTAFDVGKTGDEIERHLGMLLAMKGSVASSLIIGTDIQKLGVIGREKTRLEQDDDDRWTLCARRIRQIAANGS